MASPLSHEPVIGASVNPEVLSAVIWHPSPALVAPAHTHTGVLVLFTAHTKAQVLFAPLKEILPAVSLLLAASAALAQVPKVGAGPPNPV